MPKPPSEVKERVMKTLTMMMMGMLLALGCDDGREDFERFVAEQEAQGSGPKRLRRRCVPPPSPSRAPISLVEQEVADMGVALEIPEGSRTLNASAASTTLLAGASGRPPRDQRAGPRIRRGVDRASSQRRHHDGVAPWPRARELDTGGLEVVLAPQGVLQRVFVHRGRQERRLHRPA